MIKNLLFVDDNSETLESLVRALKLEFQDTRIHAAVTAESAISLFLDKNPAVVVLDLDLGTSEGAEAGYTLLAKILEMDPTARVIILTGHGGTEFGIKALRVGAANFLEKPADIKHLAALITDAFFQAELRKEYTKLRQTESQKALMEIAGASPQVKALREEILYAASTNQPVLLIGETGTGKGVCAKLIHKCSKRSTRPFIRCQPNFSDNDLVSSELFGHRKGAFTGALENRTGLVKEADGGTLFIDEIHELPQETQVMLLDTIQEKRSRPVGSNTYEASDFRLISAMNVPEKEVLESGRMRRDFYHRIAAHVIRIPTLRERKGDIVPLLHGFLAKLSEKESLGPLVISDSAVQKLSSHDFPGNIRELEMLIQNGAYRAQYQGRDCIDEDDLHIQGYQETAETRDLHRQVEAYKSKLIREALQRNDGNQMKAAAELGIDRGMIRRTVKQPGFERLLAPEKSRG